VLGVHRRPAPAMRASLDRRWCVVFFPISLYLDLPFLIRVTTTYSV